MSGLDGRGEMIVGMGGRELKVAMRANESAMLQKRLGCEPIAHLAKSGGLEDFCIEFVFCGTLEDKKVNPKRVGVWINDPRPITVNGTEVTLTELRRECLYLYALGKREEEAKEMVETLDDLYSETRALDTWGNDAASPSDTP